MLTQRLFTSDKGGMVILGLLALMAIVVPVLTLAVPADSPLHLSTYSVTLLGKFLCCALLALSLDLIWGYAGILSLGHDVFFALGGYGMGMYLMRQIGARGVYGNAELPDFMVFLNWQELPWYWQGFQHFPFALLMIVLVPGLLALVFGWLAFRSRVTGVYLSIITQALTFALMLAFFRNEMGFGGNNGLTLYIDEGELRCIIGPNGAGKTTMMDVITGKTRPDTGRVFFGQTIDLLQMSEHEIAHGGIGRKFQKPTVFEQLSVFENLELAMAGNKSVWASLFYRLTPEQQTRIEEVLATIGLTAHARRQAGLLSHGQKQWLEIGMLLMQNPRVLLVDEPVAGMTHEETERTAELLTSLAGQHSVIVVEHDMAFVRSIARKVTVLHQGSVLAEGSMDQIQNNPEVIEVYLGE